MDGTIDNKVEINLEERKSCDGNSGCRVDYSV